MQVIRCQPTKVRVKSGSCLSVSAYGAGSVGAGSVAVEVAPVAVEAAVSVGDPVAGVVGVADVEVGTGATVSVGTGVAVSVGTDVAV